MLQTGGQEHPTLIHTPSPPLTYTLTLTHTHTHSHTYTKIIKNACFFALFYLCSRTDRWTDQRTDTFFMTSKRKNVLTAKVFVIAAYILGRYLLSRSPSHKKILWTSKNFCLVLWNENITKYKKIIAKNMLRYFTKILTMAESFGVDP